MSQWGHVVSDVETTEYIAPWQNNQLGLSQWGHVAIDVEAQGRLLSPTTAIRCRNGATS